MTTIATIPQAIQILTRTNKVQRTGWCPAHGNRSSIWLGVQPNLLDETTLWIFLCRLTDHAAHHFSNTPASGAPTKADEVQVWVEEQKRLRDADVAMGKKKAGQ